MTTTQDHMMEFPEHPSKYRRKHHECRTTGRSRDPCECHNTGYDGEEEHPDEDRFSDPGDQFAGKTPREEDDGHMFDDKSRQYFDEAEERGDQSDPNDICPDHEAEPGQEGMGNSEKPHQVSPPIC